MKFELGDIVRLSNDPRPLLIVGRRYVQHYNGSEYLVLRNNAMIAAIESERYLKPCDKSFPFLYDLKEYHKQRYQEQRKHFKDFEMLPYGDIIRLCVNAQNAYTNKSG